MIIFHNSLICPNCYWLFFVTPFYCRNIELFSWSTMGLITDADGLSIFVCKTSYTMKVVILPILSKVTRNYFFQENLCQAGYNEQLLNATASLLLWSFTTSTRSLKLKSNKSPNQFKVAHNITQTGPRNQDKITTNSKIFLLLYPNKSWP